MSPIDDELKAALHRRATVVPPSPDPLAGIERRAARLHRNRVAASVAGSVLAVAAIATAVPLLGGAAGGPDTTSVVASSGPDDRPTTGPTQGPTGGPTAVPSEDPDGGVPSSPYALDLTDPWPYRGTPLDELGQGFVDTVTREYAVIKAVGESDVDLVPLWGQVHEPSASAEMVFAVTVDGDRRWGVARSGEAGPEFVVDEPLPSPALALAAALPGDEVARLVVVASPEAGSIQYGPDDASEFADMQQLADGVAVTPHEGDPETATYRVLDRAGRQIVRSAVPAGGPPSAGPQPSPSAFVPPPPTNVVSWPVRGGDTGRDLLVRAEAAAARTADVPAEQVASRRLFGAERDGRVYLLLQVWFGGDAQVLAYRYDPRDGSEASVLHAPTAPGPAVLVASLDGVLIVVPEPAAGQVLYAPDATSEPQPVPDQGTEVAVVLDRPETRTGDTLLVLDGDGDPERPLYRGPVAPLLAALE